MANNWTRSLLVTRVDEGSPLLPPTKPVQRKPFMASFERGHQRPMMSLLLGWEYGRTWLVERDNFLRETRIKAKSRYIKPDFAWWINKRTVVLDRRKLFRRQQTQQIKNHNMTAFAVAKEMRIKRAKDKLARTAAPSRTDVSKCTCKDCKRKIPCLGVPRPPLPSSSQQQLHNAEHSNRCL